MGWTFSSAFENIHLEYRAMRSTFSSAFKIIQNLNIELWVRHWALYSKTYILISSCEFNIQLCIQNNTHFEYRAMGSTFSSAFENIHFDNRAVSSTFSSEFKIIHTLNIELWVRHSALHSKTYFLNIISCEFNIQLCIQNNTHFENRAMGSTFSSAFENIHLEYRAVSSTYSSAFKIIHTLNIEL